MKNKMRRLCFDSVLRIGNVGLCMLAVALVCMACDPKAKTGESELKTTENTSPDSRKVTPKASSEDKDACREAVETLLKIAGNGKNKDAASLLVYRGADKGREWKTTCDYVREEDQLFVDKTMAKLQVISAGLESHTFREFITEKEQEGVWYVWVTDMRYQDGSQDEKAFAFLKIKGKFALGDID
jgi:hypothetical protein